MTPQAVILGLLPPEEEGEGEANDGVFCFLYSREEHGTRWTSLCHHLFISLSVLYSLSRPCVFFVCFSQYYFFFLVFVYVCLFIRLCFYFRVCLPVLSVSHYVSSFSVCSPVFAVLFFVICVFVCLSFFTNGCI